MSLLLKVVSNRNLLHSCSEFFTITPQYSPDWNIFEWMTSLWRHVYQICENGADKNCMTYAGRHKDGLGLGTTRILREKGDCKQSIKYSILLLMLVVLKLKYSFACFLQQFCLVALSLLKSIIDRERVWGASGKPQLKTLESPTHFVVNRLKLVFYHSSEMLSTQVIIWFITEM